MSAKKLVLGLDTSGAPLLSCVTDGVKTYSVRRKGVKQERLLFPAIHAVLAKAGGTLADIQKICFIRGPGRFTGIRISLTFASMLQYLNQTKVYSATLFEVLHWQAANSAQFKKWKEQNPAGVLAVVLHAFREEYFLQFFESDASSPVWLSREELLQKLAAFERPLFLAGTDKDNTSLRELTGGKYTLADLKTCLVQPQSLTALAENEKYTVDALEPLYLKPARFELGK